MPVLLFIHGTGVRGEAYYRSLDLVARKARQFLPGVTVAGCNWGEPFGARLNKDGVSVPDYDVTGNAAPALEDANRARWQLLAQDPLLELRVLPEESFVGAQSGEWIWAQISKLGAHPTALALLTEWELDKPWPQTIARLEGDPTWEATIRNISQSRAAASDQVARAIMAAFQIDLREGGWPGISSVERDKLKDALLEPLGGPPLGVRDWFGERLTRFAARYRGRMSDATSPGVGDILRYQARGAAIRNFIGRTVKKHKATILLGHSLGGIAAVDWLASDNRPIDCLITIGTQAPYLYEIDALVSCGFGKGLPDFFPKKWLNFFDRADFLSYRGAGVFPGRVEDREVNNGQPFPESHGAYFQNDRQVWQEIADFLAKRE